MATPAVRGPNVPHIQDHPLFNVAASALLAGTCTTLTAGAGAIIGGLAELSALVADYALRLFTTNEALIRTACRIARPICACYLATLTNWAPIALGPTAILLTLGSVAIAHLCTRSINDVFDSVPSLRLRAQTI